MKPRALLDTNILVAGLSSQAGASFVVLEAAINGQASHLVTLNVRDFTPAASHWRVALIAPGSFLRFLEKLP